MPSGIRNAGIRTTDVPLTIQVYPSAVSASSISSYTMVTDYTTVSVVSGGSGPYTYSWIVDIVGDMSSCVPTDSTSATTAFICSGVFSYSTYCRGLVTVTETSTGKQATATVDITASFIGELP